MKQCVVIGAGRFGTGVASTLSEKGCEVTLIDINEERVRDMADIVTQAVQLDATDEKSLKALGIEEVDAAVVAVGDMEASILITMNLKEMGVKWVIAKATSEAHYKILTRIGADRIVSPEQEMGVKVAHSIMRPSIFEFIEVSPGYSIIETDPPPDIVDRTIEESKVRSRYGVDIIAIKHKRPVLDSGGESRLEEEVKIVPQANDIIRENDIIVVIGSEDKLRKFKG